MTDTSRQTIAIDIDDVLASTTETIRRYINEKYKLNLQPEHYDIRADYWGYYEIVWKNNGLDPTGLFEDFVEKMLTGDVEIGLLPSAEFAMEELLKKYDIIFITSRDREWEAVTRKWFEKNFNNNTIDLYFAKSHKDTVSKTKGQLCRELGVSILIDDNTDHCKSAVEEGIKTILFGEYGWQYDIPQGVIRCKDWPSVLEYLNGQ